MYTDFTGSLTRSGIAILLALGIATFVMLLFRPSRGLQTTYDSHDFIAASEGVSNYLHGVNADGKALLHRQPLLPLYLSFFTDKISAAKMLNIICLASSVLLFGSLLRLSSVNGFYFYGGISLIVFSYPFLQPHFFVWSEPLFLTFTLLLIYLIITNRSIAWIFFICMLLFFTRKAGAFLMAGVVCWFMVERKIKMALLLGLAFAFVVMAWEIFVYTLSHGAESSLNILEYLLAVSRAPYADSVTAWFLPRQLPVHVRIFLLMFSVVIFLRIFYRDLLQLFGMPRFRFLFILVVCYFFCQIVPFGAPDFHEAERYLSVMLPPVFLLMVMMLDKITSGTLRQPNYLKILFLMWCIYPVLRTCYHMVEKNSYGQW